MSVEITDIGDRIIFWLRESLETTQKIAAAYRQKGGWEGWAQVEIAYLIQTSYSNVTIDREVNVYANSRMENDFVITPTGGFKVHIVELKCERGTQTAAQFRAEYESDIVKINTTPISPQYKPAKAFAVAISCTEDSMWQLRELREKYKIISLQHNNIYVWIYEKEIH